MRNPDCRDHCPKIRDAEPHPSSLEYWSANPISGFLPVTPAVEERVWQELFYEDALARSEDCPGPKLKVEMVRRFHLRPFGRRVEPQIVWECGKVDTATTPEPAIAK